MNKLWYWLVKNDAENGYIVVIIGILGFFGLCAVVR